MIKDALKYLIDLGNKKVIDVDGQSFATGTLQLVNEPVVDPIYVQNLSGLIDYLKSDFDVPGEVLIHVVDPETVKVLSMPNTNMKRHEWIIAKAFVPTFNFDSYYDAEQFNIKLQSIFLKNEDRD